MHRKEGRKFNTKELLDKYFREQERIADTSAAASSREAAFDKKKVYRNILRDIGRRKLSVRAFAWKWQVAAVISMLLCVSILGYFYSHRTLVKEAALGEIKIITLNDGTKIWLNAGSRLTYPYAFDDNNREVTLDGEAYFDVAHNDSVPFLVHTDQVTTRVLGTRFNISAYPGEKDVTVSVDQGKVGVSAAADDPAGDVVLVKAKQRAVYNKMTKALARDESTVLRDPAAWTDGVLIYQNAPLSEIIDDIQRTYNVKIATGKDIRNCIISADFNQDSLNKILRILAELVNGEITQREGRYVLSGAGCREPL